MEQLKLVKFVSAVSDRRFSLFYAALILVLTDGKKISSCETAEELSERHYLGEGGLDLQVDSRTYDQNKQEFEVEVRSADRTPLFSAKWHLTEHEDYIEVSMTDGVDVPGPWEIFLLQRVSLVPEPV